MPPVPVIELRVHGTLVATAARRHAHDTGSKREFSAERLAQGKAVVVNGHGLRTAQQYRMRTMCWDLQSYQGRTVQLMLSISLDNQLKGLVWHALATLPAIGSSPPHAALNEEHQ